MIRYEELVEAHRVHTSLYTDARVFADEMEQIFTRGWVFVGHESEIRRPGDFVTRHIGTQPVIMVRGANAEVSVLLNRCAHRGTLLCPSAVGNVSVFSCPYHGWTYDLGGELLGVPYPGAYGGAFDKAAHGVTRAARVSSYRGFVFATFSPEGAALDEHLGPATRLIDRACDLSPEGEIELTAGWVKHRCASNWKMLPENDIDGYHLGFVHRALWKTVRTQYHRVIGEERSIKAVVRDWGNGHIEIDWSPGYEDGFEWLGGVSGDLVAGYVAAMERRDGRELARQRLFEGPPHALIFPNLFLGETNIAIVQPVNVEECVHWHTPMFLKGVPELNKRLLRQSEAAMGPASFLLPDDVTIAGRNQAGLHARSAEWLEVVRGLNREYVDDQGRLVSHVTDETTNRAFWAHYRKVMAGGAAGRRGAGGPTVRGDQSDDVLMVPDAEYRAVVDFLYREARLADEARYAEWHALWTDDGVYWVPATTDPEVDPDVQISHIYDNRHRIATRVKMLQTGNRFSQTPASSMRRLISNIEVSPADDGELLAESNFILAELSVQAKHEMHLWAGRTTHRLRRVDGELRMAQKKVVLINAAEPLPNLSFLI